MKRSVLAILVVLASASLTHAAATPQQTCRSVKNKVAGKYAACRQTAESTFAKSAGDQAATGKRTLALGKCQTAFAAAWKKANDKATAKQAACSDAPLTDADFSTVIDAHTQTIADALAGTGLVSPAAQLAQCTAANVTCTTNLGTCQTASQTCTSNLTTCNADKTTCLASLAQEQLCGNGTKDTGEACDGSDLGGATCASQGFATGTLRCGAGCALDSSACFAARFFDTGDGTVIDRATGLEWEKKTGTPGIPNLGDVHDVNRDFTWSATAGTTDGAVFLTFLATLNGALDGVCFAGERCDWRLPDVDELGTIRECPTGALVCIDPVFGVTGDVYWTMTSGGAGTPPASAGTLNFDPGPAFNLVSKTQSALVRAVRTVRSPAD